MCLEGFGLNDSPVLSLVSHKQGQCLPYLCDAFPSAPLSKLSLVQICLVGLPKLIIKGAFSPGILDGNVLAVEKEGWLRFWAQGQGLSQSEVSH